MTFADIAAAAAAERLCGLRYEQSGHRSFRDRITVYTDGRILMQRYCYGEAAGLVFELWGDGVQADGTILWDWSSCANSHREEAPRRLTGGDTTALLLDEKQAPWNCVERLKHDPAHGYTALRGLLRRIFGKTANKTGGN